MKKTIRWDIWLLRAEPIILPDGSHFDIEGVIYEDVEFDTINPIFERASAIEGDTIWRDAEQALKIHMSIKYPNKKYQVFYWTWLN